MSFIQTKSVIDALKSKLETMVFPSDSSFAGQSLFQSVEAYDIPRLETALRDLLNFDDRICLIVPMPETFENTTSGGELRTIKRQQILLILSDKDYVPGKPAFFGNDTQPGVLCMKDIVVEQLLGASLDLNHVIFSPVDGESLRVAEDEKQLQKSREGYRLIFETPMGEVRAQIQRGRSLKR